MSEKVAPSGLTLATEQKGDTAIVRCGGRLVAGETDRLYTEIRQLFSTSKQIILDLKDVTHMDSMGLGTVVRLYVSAKSAGCVLELLNPGKSIRQLLGVTHLMSVLQVIGENNIRMV